MAPAPLWWEMRPAQSRQPKTYTCPICRGRFLAMVPNVLLSPQGDRERRRHAHVECVRRSRAAGGLPTRAEYERAQRPATPGRRRWPRLSRLWRRDRRD